ncbi:hypothetical protein I317_02455 [Kwoniella heveanensis CBS 569]|uniref:Ser-Thr-rich glycosyl-phosphatidyl-inositol-anchored membrane family-domain-containing protein n=1 Tax=Kwoniella heveanensis BCC8398 TaxID=1296120 RepID=A0A1B9GTA5_9TREE|nr:hypothetical protein I316_04196 [Kwoniella heveanensis BCC8398]OCF43702.1 hypothetical protein I317_02455 [Kwoniella heveanensis CBS 569]
MLAHLAITFLALASTAQAAISILYPNSQTIWYKNNTVHMNWTRTEPSTDIYDFRAYLSNSDQSLLSDNRSIADSTNATAEYVRVLLPQISDGQGYLVRFVNTSNEDQVFATSEPFEIQAGEVHTSSTSGSSTSASSRTGNIPNAATQATTSNPFPTSITSETSGAGTTSGSSNSASALKFDTTTFLFQAGVSIFLVGVGAGLTL